VYIAFGMSECNAHAPPPPPSSGRVRAPLMRPVLYQLLFQLLFNFSLTSSLPLLSTFLLYRMMEDWAGGLQDMKTKAARFNELEELFELQVASGWYCQRYSSRAGSCSSQFLRIRLYMRFSSL
jgi:hypothetical protein